MRAAPKTSDGKSRYKPLTRVGAGLLAAAAVVQMLGVTLIRLDKSRK